MYQKSLRDNPEMAQAVKNPVSRFWQKQKIKRQYAKAARAAGQTAQGAASTAKTTATAAKKAAKESKKAASFVARHWKGALLIGGVGLLLPVSYTHLRPTMPLERTTAPSTGLTMTPFTAMCCEMCIRDSPYPFA